jgi:hypothetical protein
MKVEQNGPRQVRRTIAALFGISLVATLYRVARPRPGQISWDSVEPTRDEEFPSRFVPREKVPKPLEGWEDAVGGIESITIAGKRYWFGFCHGADAVISPLIDDRGVMAQFGSDYLLQTDGAHPPEYWDELVGKAVNLSDLSIEEGNRDFSGSEARDALEQIAEARRTKSPARGLRFPYHLSYLLDATTKGKSTPPYPCMDEKYASIKQLNQSQDCLSGALKVASGSTTPPFGTEYDDALEIISEHIAYWRRSVPENWRSLLLGA